MNTWYDVPDGSPFPATNLPYGAFSPATSRRGSASRSATTCSTWRRSPRPRVSTGGTFRVAVAEPVPGDGPAGLVGGPVLAAELLEHEGYRDLVESHLVPRAEVTLHLPFEVADYVDFYSSQHHAENVGRIFRPDGDALTPNWKHLPIGYHGRSGTVVVSGTDVVRPSGQRKPPDADAARRSGRRCDSTSRPRSGSSSACRRRSGTPVPTEDFREHVFGVCLVNDWSARDLQAWEYVPLGPFLGKSFATSVSPWVVPLDALLDGPGRRAGAGPGGAALPRAAAADWGLDLELEVSWNGTVVSRPPFAGMYWTPDQQLAHLTVNGASLRTGDLFASGTVSGPERDQRGSFLELSWNGTEPVTLADGSTRTFLEDGDEVSVTAWAPGADGQPDRLRRGHRPGGPGPRLTGVRRQDVTNGSSSAPTSESTSVSSRSPRRT